MKDFSDQLKTLPLNPGCYIMRDKSDVIIYVGKSKCLKNRVSQYFHGIDKKDQKIKNLVGNINSIECIVTDSDLDALILEYKLIKTHQPIYNSQHKRNRKSVYARLSLSDAFPSFTVSQSKQADGAAYYCISSNIQEADELIRFIADTWKLRTCTKAVAFNNYSRNCLRYDLGKCIGPCQGGVDERAYEADVVLPTLSFMNGGKKHLRTLTNDMNQCAENMDFEKAASLRDRLQRLRKLSLHIRRLNVGRDNRQYLVLVSSHSGEGKYQLFFISQGNVISGIRLTYGIEENKNRVANYIRELYNESNNQQSDREFFTECIQRIHVKRYYISLGGLKSRMTELKVKRLTSRIMVKLLMWYQKEKK